MPPASSSSRSKRSSSTSTRSIPASSCRSSPSAKGNWSRCGHRAAGACGWFSMRPRAATGAKEKNPPTPRPQGREEGGRLPPPIQMTLEKALAYINDDELVEVTPKSIRLRKKLLDPHARKRNERRKEAERV